MADSLVPADRYCPACFVRLRQVEANTLRCEKCNLVLSRDDFDEVLKYAYDAATYGYLYPKVEGTSGPDTKYSLATAPTLVWMALAAVSGLIGGISYDVLKLALSRIIGQKREMPIVAQGQTSLATREVSIGERIVMSIDTSENELDAFISSVESYVAACRTELATGTFDPPSGRDEYVRTLLRAQSRPGWKHRVLSEEELEQDFEQFRASYRDQRKRDLERVELYRSIFLQISARIEERSTKGGHREHDR